MKTLYLDCGMGAAGDMLTAALAELLPEPEEFIKKLNSLGIPGVETRIEKCKKCGITGSLVSVTVNGEEEGENMHSHGAHHSHDGHHSHGESVMEKIGKSAALLSVSAKVRENILGVYSLIAEAESNVHGVPVSDIHFHEVGTADALADIAAVCLLMEELAPDEIVVSPVNTGFGQVKCAHGILPVPAPATAYILRDVPVYGGSIEGELCTPTGAALLKYFADRFGPMPVMKVSGIGYGMGKKDFPAANCVRAMLGESENAPQPVFEISFNVDDMTGEETAFACEMLTRGGALDVFTVPAGMKKSRPGVMITVLCKEEDREKILGIIFRHTSTIGVRESAVTRYVLERKETVTQTAYGPVGKKVSSGFGVTKEKYEYEDLARIAREKGISLKEARALIEK